MTDQRSGPAAVGTGSGLLILAILVLLAIRSAPTSLVNLRQWLWSVLNLPPVHVVACSAAVLAVLVAVAVSGAAWLRTRWTRRTLASRVSYLLLPADDFDPTEEAVLRAAGQLSRVRRAVLGWLDTRASAVRLRMDSGPEGRVLYRVEVAARARSVVRAAFSSMGAVEVREESASEEEIRA
jgi:uncharacterized integral membrane protein